MDILIKIHVAAVLHWESGKTLLQKEMESKEKKTYLISGALQIYITITI